MPLRNGRCGFCDTRVVGADDQPLTEKETPVAKACKVDGCTNPEKGSGGPWKGMCQEHISAEIARRSAVRYAKQPKPAKAKSAAPATAAPKTNGHAALTLTELALAVDQAHAAYADALTRLREAVNAA